MLCSPVALGHCKMAPLCQFSFFLFPQPSTPLCFTQLPSLSFPLPNTCTVASGFLSAAFHYPPPFLNDIKTPATKIHVLLTPLELRAAHQVSLVFSSSFFHDPPCLVQTFSSSLQTSFTFSVPAHSHSYSHFTEAK